MRLIVARCSVEYSGRLSARLPEALRLVMLKADGSVLVHADAGGYKPLNWMTPPTVVEEEDGRIVVRKLKGEDRLDIELTEVLSDVEHTMDFDAAQLEKDGVEADLQVLLADAPEWCGEGFRLVRREWPTDIGPVDLMCRDDEDGWVAVEIKRVGTIDAVEQLARYLERIRLDPAMADCRGVLAAQVGQAAGTRARRGARAGLGGGRPRRAARGARAGADAVRMSAVGTAVEGEVLVVTIDRPEARNAVNLAVAEGIAAAMDRLDEDDALRAGILTGAGGTFCAGMDLKAFVAGERPYVGDRGFAGITQRAARKPLIAAVEGWALAGGFEVALACDVIVAARDARFGIPEVKRGLVAAAGALLRLPRRIPYHLAMELALTGEPIGAERAAAIGVVSRLTEPGESLAGARELAALIARNGPLAVDATKRIVAAAADWPADEAWERQGEIAGPVFTSDDAREGATAFAEKREPVWRGR